MLKKIITLISILSVLFSIAAPAYALESTNSSVGINSSSRAAERSQIRVERMQTKEQNRSTKLNDRADQEIQRRIKALNKLITKINDIKRLTPDQKSSFISQIQIEISNLQTLDTKIKSDTDLTTLKTDVQSIIKSYRVFLLFIPKINLVAAADRIGSIADEMSSLSAKLQTRINDAKSSGEDVTSLETLLSDMNAKISGAQTQARNAINAVLPLTPDGYPANASILQSARRMIQTGRLDLVTALQDAQKIRQGLKTPENKEGSESASLTPTGSSTATTAPQPTQ